jgi:2-iminobutanoate/2-iminopropanoate deaminase
MKQIINTPSSPGSDWSVQSVNPVQRDAFFVSGQIALDPATGELVLENIEAETHRVLQNVQAILEAAGSSFEKVLKASVFVKDMNMFGRINAVYGEYFNPEWAPARELVQVAELPRFVNVETSVIATV